MSILLCFLFLAFGNLSNASRNGGLAMYEIKKGDFSLKVTNYGARIASLVLPDKHGQFFFFSWVICLKDSNFFLVFIGKLGDIVLGYDTAEEFKV